MSSCLQCIVDNTGYIYYIFYCSLLSSKDIIDAYKIKILLQCLLLLCVCVDACSHLSPSDGSLSGLCYYVCVLMCDIHVLICLLP